MKSIGKPDARNGHVRFDERGRETGRGFAVSTRARPRLYMISVADLARYRFDLEYEAILGVIDEPSLACLAAN